MELQGKAQEKLVTLLKVGDTLQGQMTIKIEKNERVYFYSNDMFGIFQAKTGTGEYIFQYHPGEKGKRVDAGTGLTGEKLMAAAPGHWECLQIDEEWEPVIYLVPDSTIDDITIQAV